MGELKLADVLAAKYNIDRETVKYCLQLYMGSGYLTHTQKVKIVHDYLRAKGYGGTQ